MADFTTRFNELLTRTTDNDTTLAEALGVSKQAISAWKKGDRFPKRPTITIIASYFGVGVPWLQGITDDETAGMDYNVIKGILGASSPASQKLQTLGAQLVPWPSDPGETDLVDLYRGLNERGQQTLMDVALSLTANPDMKKAGNDENA